MNEGSEGKKLPSEWRLRNEKGKNHETRNGLRATEGSEGRKKLPSEELVGWGVAV